MASTESDEFKEKFDIKTQMETLISILEEQDSAIKRRLIHFSSKFNEEFPESEPEDRGHAETIIWALMDAPIVLYALDMNGPAIVELHAIIERFSIRDLTHYISKPNYKEKVTKIMERLNLKDVAKLLADFGIYDEEDLKFIEQLSKYRNGVAHKNPRIISNLFYSGRPLHFSDIDGKISEIDCIPFILKSVRTLMKLSSYNNDSENHDSN